MAVRRWCAARALLSATTRTPTGLPTAASALPLRASELTCRHHPTARALHGVPTRPASAPSGTLRAATWTRMQSLAAERARGLCTTPEQPPERAQMHMVFTCGKCGTRALKSFSRKSYMSGVVIATCPGCDARHLVADNLGWFGEERNIEEILAKKGVHVPVLDANGEYAPPDVGDGGGGGGTVDRKEAPKAD